MYYFPNSICKQYSLNNNAYHNFVHITNMLCELNNISFCINEYEKLILVTAILYHDIVYFPGACDNEDLSVEFFKKSEMAGGDDFNSVVSNLIMATKCHNKGVDKLSDIIIDLDMMILGQQLKDYNLYSKQIRIEYKYVEDDIFFPARLLFLKKLNCENYFSSFNDSVNNVLNMNMKNNINYEIAYIESRLGGSK